MGKNSKARRDAKAKSRQRQARAAAGGTPPRGHDDHHDHHHGGPFGGTFGDAPSDVLGEVFGEAFADIPARAEDEASTAAMLDMAWSALDPADGVCGGPLLIHQDGSFECHGDHDDGRSAMKTWHDFEDAVWPCHAPDRPAVDEIFQPCSRCG